MNATPSPAWASMRLAAILFVAGCGARTGMLADEDADADGLVADADVLVHDADEPAADADVTVPHDTWIRTLTASGGVRAMAAGPGGRATMLGWAPDGVSLFLATVSPGGEVLEHHLLQGVDAYALDAAAHPDGGFIVVSDVVQDDVSGYDVWVARFDDGNRFLWQERLALSGEQRPAEVAVTPSGLALVTASMPTPDGQLDDLWAVAIEPDGAIAWQLRLDAGERIVEGGTAGADAEGVVISSTVFDGLTISWLVALTLDGEVRWQRVIEPADDEWYTVLGLHADDRGLVLAGQYIDIDPPACEPWVARMSGAGELEWQWTYSDGECGWFEWIVADGDELIVLGDVNVAPYDSPDWAFEQWLVRLDRDGRPNRQVRYAFSGSSYSYGMVESGDELVFAGDAYFGDFSAFAARVTRNGDVEGRCDSISAADTVPVETTAVASPFEGRLVATDAYVVETGLWLSDSSGSAETICPQ